MINLNKIAFVDIETTGSRVGFDRIIELCIIKVENNQIIQEYTTFLNPESYVSPYIELMTGISAQDLENAPTFREIQDKVYELLHDCVFVAHNVRFDYGFMKYEFKREGISYNSDNFCTVKLSRHFYPAYHRHNLDSIIERFNFECKQRHRAYSDTFVLWQFYQHLQKTFSAEEVVRAIEIITQRSTLPKHLDESIIVNMPESPGIYIFYDDHHIPLYIGKGKNIKSRVLSHFNEVLTSAKEMDLGQQVHSIEWEETAGELGALLLEAKLVKDMQPIYNRQLRKNEETIVIRQKENEAGYFIPHIETLEENDTSQNLGVFKTKAKAKQFLKSIGQEYQLCNKLLGLEKTRTSCFDYKLEKCFGACVNKEPVTEYNQRFTEAFQNNKIQEWPYHGPIIIEERTREEGRGEGYIFDSWCYRGQIKWDRENTSYINNTLNQFDYDVYMILKRHLNHDVKIRELKSEEFFRITES